MRRVLPAVKLDGMARKKKPTEGRTDMPPAAPAPPRKGSRHKPRKMMPLPPWLYTLLKADARRNSRPATWHLRHIVIRHLLDNGGMTEEQLRQHVDPDDHIGTDD